MKITKEHLITMLRMFDDVPVMIGDLFGELNLKELGFVSEGYLDKDGNFEAERSNLEQDHVIILWKYNKE